MNMRASLVHLWWRNYDGKRVSYGSVQPNAPMEMTTYVTHPWVITDEETGLSLGIWNPTVETGLILINDSTTTEDTQSADLKGKINSIFQMAGFNQVCQEL